MDPWTSRCLLGVPVDLWITKTITQGVKMEPQGLQNDRYGYQKSFISAVKVSTVASCQEGGLTKQRRHRSNTQIHNNVFEFTTIPGSSLFRRGRLTHTHKHVAANTSSI